jgi:rubrerythrin
MTRILIIAEEPRTTGALLQALRNAQWDVEVAARVPLPFGSGRKAAPDAVVLIARSGRLASALRDARRAWPDAPIVLVTDLDRSGWDRTFAAPEALDVDALFDLPADPDALVRRLRGILQARAAAKPAARGPEMPGLIERAIANEEISEAFYRRAARSVARPETKETLQALAVEENEHKRLLQQFRSGAASLPSDHVQVASLVESLGAPEITPDMTPADAFLLAARKEKLAMEFYENWAALYPEGRERALLLQLAEVERRHKARVEALFTNAAFPEVWE